MPDRQTMKEIIEHAIKRQEKRGHFYHPDAAEQIASAFNQEKITPKREILWIDLELESRMIKPAGLTDNCAALSDAVRSGD